ncbi:hypothetical protein BDZ90DRAFT_232380 [Jaminaea rosea]|uniref:ABM domain-containing protein n=1 Tax=Jaminaea rosea TaxID=1569628 RepID=A0A316UST8_9BASI|nr:hypothetical protein BDZ90DRAFT_232380 [Jaminaea rosea]PWN27401.1 hypothetical protein BDZ90DRAFT_232380 [Jaminaea rosea]
MAHLPKDDLSQVPDIAPVQLLVHIQPKAGKEDEVASHLAKIQAKANSDDEPDTTVYRVSKSVQGPVTFIVYEEYKTKAGMKHHTEQEEFKAFFAKAGELLELIHPRWFTKL